MPPRLTIISDTLHRHELSHHTIGTDGGKDRTHRITVKTFRACYKCALARVRCSGGIPCTRCENRSLECQYPTERRSKAKVQKATTQTISLGGKGALSGSTSHPFSAHGPEASQNKESGHLVGRPGYQMGQFQLHVPESHNVSTSRSDGMLAPNVHAHLEHDRDSPSLIRADVAAVSESFPPYGSVNQQLYPQAPSTQVQPPLAVDQKRLSYPLDGQHNEVPPPGNFVAGIPGSDNAHVQLGFPQPLLGQSAVPTINWLSSDFLLESAPDQGLTPGPQHPFQAGVFDGSLSQTTWLPPVINTEPQGSSLSGSISQTPSGTTSLGDVESPGHFARGVRQQSQSGPSKRPTDHTIDEPSERLPKHRRTQSSWPTQNADSLDIFLKFQNSKPQFAFPPTQELQTDSVPDTPVGCNLEPTTYDEIHHAFLRLCCTENFLYSKFESSNFPDTQTLSNFLHHYFHFFHPIYPIFHTPTFNPNKCHWIVTLALATIGSHSASFCEQNGTATAFHEFLRRAVCVEVSSTNFCACWRPLLGS